MTDEYTDVPDEGDDQKDNKVLTDLRAENDRLKRIEKDYGKAQRELDGFRAKERESQLKLAAKEVGLADRHLDLFSKVMPDATPSVDSLKAFAEEYSLLPANQETAVTEVQEQVVEPVIQGAPPGQAEMSREEFDALVRRNPGEAFKKKAVAWRHEQSRQIAEGTR
jgi:hypothetical protein